MSKGDGADQAPMADIAVETEGDYREIALEQIRVEHNPRSASDSEELARLARSIEIDGVQQPILVCRDAEAADTYILIAGQRRLEASRMAGRSVIPAMVEAHVETQTRRVWALRENMVREEMTPADEGRAIAQFMEYGLPIADAAALIPISAKTARERLAMVRLPGEARSVVEDGLASVSAAASLVRVAEVSKDLCEEIARRLREGELDSRDLAKDPYVAAMAIASEETGPKGVVCVPFGEGDNPELGELAEKVEVQLGQKMSKGVAEAVAKAKARSPLVGSVALEERDWARATGGLLELRRPSGGSDAFLADVEVAGEWLIGAVERAIADAERDAEGGAANQEGPEDEDLKAARSELEAARQNARAANAALGMAVRRRLDHQKQVTLGQAQVICALLMEEMGEKIVEGVRICRPEFCHVERTHMKSGMRSVERWLSRDEARAQLDGMLRSATNAEELLGRLFGAIACGVIADRRAMSVAESTRRTLVVPHREGREETIFGRAFAAFFEEIEGLVSEDRGVEIRRRFSVGESAAIRDRRAPRQVAEAERAEERMQKRLAEAEGRIAEAHGWQDELAPPEAGESAAGEADLEAADAGAEALAGAESE